MFNIILQSKEAEPKTFEFSKNEIAIGRLSSSDIQLATNNVSKQHSRIVYREGRYFIIDRKSTNGTFVNGKRVTVPMSLKSGDKIFIGDFSLSFILPEAEAKPKQPAAKPETPPEPAAKPELVSKPEALPESDLDLELVLEPEPEEPKGPPAAASMPPPLPGPHKTLETPIIDLPSAPGLMPEGVEGERPETVGADLGKWAEQRFDLYTEALDFEEFESPESLVEYRLEDEELSTSVLVKISELITEKLGDDATEVEQELLSTTLLKELLGYGPLEDYLFDDGVEEIFVNGPDRIVVHRGKDKIVTADSFSCEEALYNVIARMFASSGVEMDEESGTFNVQLPDGYGLHGIFYPYALNGTSIRITKPTGLRASLADLQKEGVLNDAMAAFLREAVADRRSICVTGISEKDRLDMLAMLGALIPENERLALLNAGGVVALPHEDQVVLEGSAGSMVDTEFPAESADLLNHLDRMRIDRLIAGDIGEDEALELLYALNGGLAGSIFSVFGSDCADALRRLGRMARYGEADHLRALVEELIAADIDVMLCVRRFKNGERRIVYISEVAPGTSGWESNEVFFFNVSSDTKESLTGEFYSET